MKTSRPVFGVCVVAAALALSYTPAAETNTPPVRSSIPYVATRNDAVRDMLWLADVGEEDVVYDLGSGDGRIVIAAVRDLGARRAVGIEIDPERILESRENARKAGVTDRVEFIQGDVFASDFRQASVVTLFLGHRPNIKLRWKILNTLKPGSRVVSHQFGMGEWQTDKALTVRTVFQGMWGEGMNPFMDDPRVPDYTGNESHFGTSDKVLMWVVPASVAGIWRGKIETARGPQDCQLVLHQRLSDVTGTVRLSGQADLSGRVRVDVWGDHVRWSCGLDDRRLALRFDGHVDEDTMRGTMAVTDRGRLQESEWEAKRDKTDFTGTWEWPCATGPRSVRLRIEKRNGQFIATYLDGDREVRVTDFYDCGGGFYFTLLIGGEGDSVTITKDTGWLIGEGVLDDGSIKGTVEFHPYGEMSGVPDGRKASEPVIRDWAPRPIEG